MSGASDQSTWDYVIQPFETIFLSRLDEIQTLISLSSFAIGNLQGAARVAKLLRHPDERVNEARSIEELAKAELEGNFPVLHGAGVVLVWGALEAAVRDFVVRWIARCDGSLRSAALAKVRVLVSEYEALQGEDRARYLLTLLERESGAALRPGVARFECVLHAFGIVPKLTHDDRRELLELSSIRNVIVHRAGVADRRLRDLCPWLSIQKGERVRINHATFRQYATVAGNYAAAVIESGQSIFRDGTMGSGGE